MHVPYDLITDRGFRDCELDRYHVLILPNAACLSDQQAETITHFVQKGGRVVSSFLTSLRDERGRPRPNFALADVLGVNFRDIIETPRCYVKTNDTTSFAQVPNGVPFLHRGRVTKVEPQAGVEIKANIVYGREGFNQLLTTSLSPYDSDSPYPALVFNKAGEGRSLYFAGQPAMNYLHWGYYVYKHLIKGALDLVTDQAPPLIVNAPMCVEATLMEHTMSGALLAHLVNFQSELGRTWDIVKGRFVA
jgi:hypothetical protein